MIIALVILLVAAVAVAVFYHFNHILFISNVINKAQQDVALLEQKAKTLEAYVEMRFTSAKNSVDAKIAALSAKPAPSVTLPADVTSSGGAGASSVTLNAEQPATGGTPSGAAPL